MKIHIDEVDVESSVFDSLRISASPLKICSQLPVQLVLIAKKKQRQPSIDDRWRSFFTKF